MSRSLVTSSARISPCTGGVRGTVWGGSGRACCKTRRWASATGNIGSVLPRAVRKPGVDFSIRRRRRARPILAPLQPWRAGAAQAGPQREGWGSFPPAGRLLVRIGRACQACSKTGAFMLDGVRASDNAVCPPTAPARAAHVAVAIMVLISAVALDQQFLPPPPALWYSTVHDR